MSAMHVLAGAANDVDSWVADHWGRWFRGGQTRFAYRCILKGARQGRITAFYFTETSRAPVLVVKIAGNVGDRVPARNEFDALRRVRSSLPPRAVDLAPEALGLLHEGGSYAAVAMKAVAGKRMTLPVLARRSPSIFERRATLAYLKTAAEVSRQLETLVSGVPQPRSLGALSDQLAAFRSLGSVSRAAQEGLSELERHLAASTSRYTPSWQHGDVAPGNLLLGPSGAHLVDWEAARPDHAPWFDVTYSWLTLARLTQRQGGDWSAGRALAHLYSENGWLGERLAQQTQQAWPHELPRRWAATLVAVDLAMTYGEAGVAVWSPYIEALLTDDTVREHCHWMVPSRLDLSP